MKCKNCNVELEVVGEHNIYTSDNKVIGRRKSFQCPKCRKKSTE